MVRLGGHWITGEMVSCATVTVKLHTADSRQPFVARQVTMVVPKVKSAPDGGVQVTVGTPAQVSVVAGGG